MEDAPEIIALGHVLHLRARISNRDEARSGLPGANHLRHALKEILFEDVRFQRAPRFAGHQKQRVGQINLLLRGFDLRRIGGIQNVQFREPGNFAEGHLQNFRTQTGTTHTQQQHMRKACLVHVLSDLGELMPVRQLIIRNR